MRGNENREHQIFSEVWGRQQPRQVRVSFKIKW